MAIGPYLSMKAAGYEEDARRLDDAAKTHEANAAHCRLEAEFARKTAEWIRKSAADGIGGATGETDGT